MSRRSGDWTCSCGELNFARRKKCRRCSSFRNVKVSSKPGDWKCTHCDGINFRNRESCYRCKKAKSGEGQHLREKKHENPIPGRRERVNMDDWVCTCGFNNFHHRLKCKNCGRDKLNLEEKDESIQEIEFASKSFAKVGAGGNVESVQLCIGEQSHSLVVIWNTGPSCERGQAFFRNDGSGLLAAETIHKSTFKNRKIRCSDPEPYTYHGEQVFKLCLNNVPPSYDDTSLTRALDGLNLPEFIEAHVFRREMDQDLALIATQLRSLFTPYNAERIKSHPPRYGQAKCIVDFNNIGDCLNAQAATDGKTNLIGYGKLDVSLDLRTIVTTPQVVYTKLRADVEKLMETIRFDRLKFPTVKIFLFGRERSATNQARVAICGNNPQAVCLARDLYNQLLSPLVITFSNTARLKLILRTIQPFLNNPPSPVCVQTNYNSSTLTLFSKPETRTIIQNQISEINATICERSLLSDGVLGRSLLSNEARLKKRYQKQFDVMLYVDLVDKQIICVATDDEKIDHMFVEFQMSMEGSNAGKKGESNSTGTLCRICFMEIEHGEESFQLDECEHVFHRECFQHQINSALNVSGTRPVLCCGEKCGTPISLINIRKFLSTKDMDTFLKFCARDYVNVRPHEFKPCPTPDCPQLYTAGMKGLFHCSECLHQYCVSCCGDDGVPIEFHQGMSCEAYQSSKESDIAFGEFMNSYRKNQHTKNCPYCNTPTDKFTNTCNHATCVYCKTHFCWKCLWVPPDRNSGRLVYSHLTSAHGGYYN